MHLRDDNSRIETYDNSVKIVGMEALQTLFVNYSSAFHNLQKNLDTSYPGVLLLHKNKDDRNSAFHMMPLCYNTEKV